MFNLSNDNLKATQKDESGNYHSILFGDELKDKDIYKLSLKIEGYYGGIGLVEKDYREFEGRNVDEGKNKRCIIYYNRCYDPSGKCTWHSFGNLWEGRDILEVTVNMKARSLKVQNRKDSKKCAIVEGFPNNRCLALAKWCGGSFSILEQSFV